MSVLLATVQSNLEILGMQFLHNYLLQNGRNSTMLSIPRLNLEDAQYMEAIRCFIADLSPDLIGFSLTSMEYFQTRDLTRYLKQHFPEIPIVWGGSHPTAAPKASAAHTDYVCVGEGEQTILDMAIAVEEGAPLADIPNLAYYVDGEYRQNPLYPLIDDLDSIPGLEHVPQNSFFHTNREIVPIDWEVTKRHFRWGTMNYNVMTTRGCPFHCAYCCNSVLHEVYPRWGIRRRSVGHVIAELERAVEQYPALQTINFQDDCFLACTLDYLEEFCAEYKEKIGRSMIIRSTPTYVNEKKIALLYDAGLSWFSMGLQSGSPRVCEEVFRRNCTPDDFLEAARIVQKRQIAFQFDLILDNPFETMEDRYEALDVVMQIPGPAYAEMTSLIFFYRTGLYHKALADMPGRKELFTLRDVTVYFPRPVNYLFELAATLYPCLARPIINRFRRKPDSFLTLAIIRVARAIALFVVTPIIYLRLIVRAQRGSLWGAMRILPKYVRLGLERYLNTFKEPGTEYNIVEELADHD